jgi:hypothetical protein
MFRMSKRPTRSPPVRPVFHAPMRVDWSDEKLAALSQPELLTLLDNLDQQRSIGRLADGDAGVLDARIFTLLSRASRTRRNRTVKAAAAAKAALQPQSA